MTLENVDQGPKLEIIEELLKNLPTEAEVQVQLPSEGRANSEVEGGIVSVRPMTFEDEKALVSSKKSDDPINLLLDRCTSNINILELLPFDKLFLIMKIREISYGDDYEVVMSCPKCKEENPITVHLSELTVNPVPDDFVDPVEVMLPVLQQPAKIRRPRAKDEKYLDSVESTLANLWRFVVEIAGHTDKSIVNGVIAKLPLKDMKTILNAMKTVYGVETKVRLQCTSCEEVGVVELPIGANFFDVS